MKDFSRLKRRFDIASAAFGLPVLLAMLLWQGSGGLLAALAGWLVFWLDLQLLVFVVRLAARGSLTRSALTFAILPVKYLGLIGAIYLCITRLRLAGLPFVFGVSAVVLALFTVGLWHLSGELGGGEDG